MKVSAEAGFRSLLRSKEKTIFSTNEQRRISKLHIIDVFILFSIISN